MQVSYHSYVKGSTRKGKALVAATGTSVETITVDATEVVYDYLKPGYVLVRCTDGREINMPRALLVEVA